MMGLHPTSVNDNPRWREELDEAAALLKNPPAGIRFVGVGEIGLDLYWSAAFRDEQIEAFRRQCRLALECDLPIAVHTRNAWAEMERVVGEFRGSGLRGVFHAFGEDEATYRRLRALGDFRFGIGGVVTFRKSPLAETVRNMALEDIVLETDCPYLTPAPPSREAQRVGIHRLHLRAGGRAQGADARRSGPRDEPHGRGTVRPRRK